MIVAIMTTALSGTVWAETWTHAFASPEAISNNSITVDGATWNVTTTEGVGQPTMTTGTYSKTYGLKFGSSKSVYYGSVTFSTDYFNSYNVQSVTVNILNNGSKQGTLTAQQGNTSIGSKSSTFGTTWTDLTVNTNSGSGGSLSFTYSVEQAFYIHSITVTYTSGGGTPTCAIPTFNPAAGTYTSAQNVEISTTTTGATIYYTTDGNDPTTSSSVYSSAISVSANTTIKAMAVAAGYDNSSVASATYTIVSLDHAGTEADPYTVADARTLLTAAPSTTFEDVYVSGIISQVDSYNSTYKSITYWISDDGTTTDQFEVYSGKGLNGADFSSKDDLVVGSEVTVKGNIKKYNSTFEFDVNSQIVSLDEPTYPIINVENATLNLAYNATSGEIEYTITNPTSATLTATSNASWISNITVGASSVTFTTTANNGTTDREATITLSYTGAEDVTVTVTQGHYVADYATLPFSFDDGKAAIENTAGLTETGLGSDYKNSPYLKLDGTGDYVLLKINERPGVLTFDIQGNGFSGGTFTVQTSEDGQTYTDLETYTELGSTQSEEFSNLGENVRYIKWIYTQKVNGNVALGNIVLEEYTDPVLVPSITITPSTVSASAEAEEGTLAVSYENIVISSMNDFAVQFYNAEGEEISDPSWLEVLVAEQDPNVGEGYVVSYTIDANTGEARTTSFKVFAEDGEDFVFSNLVTVTQAAYVDDTKGTIDNPYTVAEVNTGNYSGNNYVIGYIVGYFNGATSNATTSGTANTVSNVALSDSPSEINGANTIAVQLPQGVIRDAWNIYENAVIGYKVLVYGNITGYFTNKTGVKSTSEITAVSVPVEVTSAGYATYCSDNALDFTNSSIKAFYATVEGSTLTFHQIYKVPAGTGVLLYKDGGATVDVPVFTGSADDATGNVFVRGTGVAITYSAAAPYYVLANGSNGVGFYKANNNMVATNRAYINAGGSLVKSFYGFEDDATGIKTIETIDNDGAIYNVAGQRLNKMQKGINIVNGKKILK